MKKLLAALLALMLCICSIALAEAPEGYPEVVEGIDLNGAEIYINYYWAPNERKADPNDEEQATYDYRDWIMETYNCKVIENQSSDWTNQVSEVINFATAPDGKLCLYILPPDFVGTPMSNNMFAEWKTDALVDFTADKWNSADLDFMTKGGKIYGVATGNSEPRQCLYFNKRVLEEAGIDWESIYDMQLEGTWTWDVFEDMLKKINKDVDNDGIIDIYGMTGNNSDMYIISVFANGAEFFKFDENGDLVIACNSDAAIEAMNWAKNIWTNYFYQQPEDGSWDYFIEAFPQGFCGFYMYQTYGGFNENSELSGMEDEWGCVAFPIGPNGDTYTNVTSDNITIIPNVYDEDTASKIAFIYDLWTNATPGYDDEDSWIGNKYNFTDDRAVDETYAMLREPDHCSANAVLYIGSVNDVIGSPLLWQIGSSDPAALVEAATPAWQALCDAFNGK